VVGALVKAADYAVAYLDTSPCGEGVASFRFSKPDGYTFSPGQFLTLTLNTRDGVVSKHFSHADAPGDPAIEVTTRLSGSAFKDALCDLKPGTTVHINAPKGRLGVPEGETAVGFLAGGVGITPAHSIIRDAVAQRTGLDIVLFYGNRDETCVPYGEEFRGYAASVPRFLYVEALDHPGPGWSGESGFISAELVHRHLADASRRHWIVAGPPPMVDAMRRVTAVLGLSPQSVAFEVFAGYDPTESSG
jgi:ferredoxin-NADP reductase